MTEQAEPREAAVSTTGHVETQLLLAFGTFRGEVSATLLGIKDSNAQILATVNALDTRQRATESDAAAMKSDIASMKTDIAALQARPEAVSIDPALEITVATLLERSNNQKTINDTIQIALAGRALTWPKLIAGAAAVVGTLVALNFIDTGGIGA